MYNKKKLYSVDEIINEVKEETKRTNKIIELKNYEKNLKEVILNIDSQLSRLLTIKHKISNKIHFLNNKKSLMTTHKTINVDEIIYDFKDDLNRPNVILELEKYSDDLNVLIDKVKKLLSDLVTKRNIIIKNIYELEKKDNCYKLAYNKRTK